MTDVQIAEFVNDRIITDRIQKGHLCLVYIIQWLGLFFAACRLPFDRNIFCQVYNIIFTKLGHNAVGTINDLIRQTCQFGNRDTITLVRATRDDLS